VVIAWRHFNDRDDPARQGKPENVGVGKTDFYGQSGDRPYEERQQKPGDYEAWCSLGEVTSHAREHLATTDRGIAMLRRKLKHEIENLQRGKSPSDQSPGTEATSRRSVATPSFEFRLRSATMPS
jgi:hypothetical protein